MTIRRRFLGDLEEIRENKMPDVDFVNRHPALQSMCSKDWIVRYRDFL